MKQTTLFFIASLMISWPISASDDFFGSDIHSRFSASGLNPLAPYVISLDGTVSFPDDEISYSKSKPFFSGSEGKPSPKDSNGRTTRTSHRLLWEEFRVKKGEPHRPIPQRRKQKRRLGVAAYMIDFQIYPSTEKGSSFYLPPLDHDKKYLTGDIFDYVSPIDLSTILNRRVQFALKNSAISSIYFTPAGTFINGTGLNSDPVFRAFESIDFPVKHYEVWLPGYGIKTVDGHIQVETTDSRGHEAFFWLHVAPESVQLDGLTSASKDYLFERLSQPI